MTTMIDHGIFEEYRPASDDPILIEIPTARFCRNAAGLDWYLYQKQLLSDQMKVLVGADNVIVAASREAGSLFPAGFQLIEIETDIDPDSLRRCMLVDGQIVAPPPPVFTRLPKAELWRRLTDVEAEALDTALHAAPIRLRRIYEAASYLDTADDDYPTLRAGIVAALGEERTAEVLAPTY